MPAARQVHIRDSKRNAESGPHLTFPLTAWAAFIQQSAGRLSPKEGGPLHRP
ncbi:DUF397 domain-containing protein [Streptomyces chrestomyceticus]|uniref:DUF397 domain-containing protein n=1 Tax=Streptomyces chrestomyceticus TaxID=68185 RepID=UPI00340280A5